MKRFVFFLSLFSVFNASAQDLTISTSGQIGTSGTNWSIIGNTLTVGASGSASIHPSVITDHLTNTGNLTIVLPPQSLQSRDIIISNNIAYTGSTARTLTFNSANGIWINSGVNISSSTSSLNLVLRAAMNSSAPDHGRIVLDGVAISTKGGHFWAGGGSTNATWNGLTVGNGSANVWADDVAALSMVVASITTEGGSVYLNGRSWESADNDGVNYGVYIENSSISSSAGNITIEGTLNGRYIIGNATRIMSTSSGNTAITTTTGSISVSGTGLDQTPNDNGFRHGVIITGWSSTAKTIISSNSGNIQIEGNANFTATVNDKEGLGIGGSTEIISRSGNISIRGTNSLESSGHYCNSIRFDPKNESNSIRVGFDGTNSYTGNILIEGNSIYQRYLHSSAGSIAVQTTGTLTIQPTGAAFTYMRADNAGTLTYDNDWNFGTTLTGFTFGKSTNTLDLNYNGALSAAGPIAVYGGNININENLNTVAGGTTGTILLKSSADITLAANKSITTSGAPVILWSNSDNASSNGSIALRNASSIVTGSNTVAGGHIWIGGGSNGTTWNGLAVGSGYAVPGTSFTPSNGGNSIQSGIYLERNSISSFGGNIKIAGDGAASARGIVSYGNTITINAGSGKIEMDGQVTSAAAGDRGGILLGLHENTIASTVNISSSSTTGDAITLTGVGRGTEDAIGLSGTLNITSSGGGNIVMNGNALGSGRSIVAGNYYHGIMNVFANSGNITLNGNTKAVAVAAAVINGLTSGPSKINIGQGGSISSSSSNVVLTADNIALAAGGIAVNTSGTVTIEPSSNSFTNALAFPITNLSIANTITGLTLGKSTNTANITVSSAQSIAGPITVYGGTLAINQNLTSTLSNAPILLQAAGTFALASNITIQSNAGNITLRSNATGTAQSTSAITLNTSSSILSQGGNITLGGNFTGTQGSGLYATANNAPAILIDGGIISAAGGNIKLYGKCNASYDDGIRLRGTINTTGAGTIELYGEAHGGYNGTDYFGGITFGSSAGSTIETENGNILLNGLLTNTQNNTTGAINFYRNNGPGGAQTNHINLLSKTGNININADIGSTGAYGIGHSSWGNVYIGSPVSGWTATGNIVFSYARLVNAGLNGFKVKTSGAVTYEPTASSFTAAQTFPPNSNYIVAENASSLTIGKSGNTADVSISSSTSVAGPISVYGGNIEVNENLNTSAGTTSGHVLLKGSADVILAANKSITTSGAPVILWANNDNEATNGSIALRNGSSIVTGSGSVAGGHVWIGGGSNGTTWNGLAVGSGYAVPGTSFTPSNGGGTLNSGVYLERNSISSFGGNIKIAGDAATGFAAIATYGNTITINAGSGKIEMNGQATSTTAGNRLGVLFGLHDNTVVSTVNISSSSTSGDAITITGVGRGTEDAIGLSGTLNITSSGGGNIVMNGNALGTGRSIVAGNYYNGILNVFANSGKITLNGHSKAVQVATPVINGLTTGPSKINIGQGGSISSSSSDITITGDQIAIAAGGIAVNSTGKLVVEPLNTSFNASVSWPITNFSVASGLTGLRLGKDGNTADITIASAQTIAGPIEVYGGNIAVNENLNTSAGNTNGDILLKASADVSLAASKSITTNGGDVIFWADQDATSGGRISLLSAASIQTSGGRIVLAGGLDNGSNSGISNDGIPDGYARGVGVSGISTTGSFTINSGSGSIFMKGSSDNRDGISLAANSSQTGNIISTSGNIDLLGFVDNGTIVLGQSGGFIQAGIRTSGGGTINIESNSGTVKVEGNAPRYGLAFGVFIQSGSVYFASDNATQTLIKTANTTTNAIFIKGNGQHGISFRGLATKIHATAALGGITVDAVSPNWSTTIYNPVEILSVSGPINWLNSTSTDGIGIFNSGSIAFGSKSGVTGLTSSSSNININIQKLSSGSSTFAIGTTGQVSILGVNGTATFGQAFSTSSFGLNANSQIMTGFTFGSASNTQNLTFDQALTVAGPITAYGGTLTLNENLSSSNGSTISLYGNGLTIASGKTVSSSGQLIVAPQAASNSIGLGGASGTLQLPASYFSTNFTDGFSNIQIGSNSQTGAINTNAFNLQDNMSFLTSGELTLGGKPVLGANNITLGSAISAINLGSPANYFQTNGTGSVSRIVSDNAALLFPVGNSNYNPVTITNNTGAADDFSVRVLDAVYLTGNSGAELTTPRVNATWDINKQTANAGSGVDFEFTWNSGQETGTMNEYQLNHFNNSTWELAAGVSAAPTGTVTKTLTHSSYTGTFSPFAIGNSSVSPLPVTLLDFEVTCEEGKPRFVWTTASEINNSHFDLEQSSDLITWEKAARIEGNGNSNQLISYGYTLEDFRASSGRYFRLHQYDYNGDSEAHFSVYLNEDCLGAGGSVSVYPNPSEGPFTLSGAAAGSEWHLTDASGRILFSRKADSDGNVFFAPELPDGMYFLRSVHQGESILKKIVIRRM